MASRLQDVHLRGLAAARPLATAVAAGTLYFATDTGVTTRCNDATPHAWESYSAVSGTGDVVGSTPSVDNEFVLYSGVTGKIIKTGGIRPTITVGTPGVDTLIPTEKAVRTALGPGNKNFLSFRILGVVTNVTINVNSTAYISLPFMEVQLDTTECPFTHYRLLFSAGSNAAGQNIIAQLATGFVTPSVPVHTGGNDLTITNAGALYDSGWLTKDVVDSGFQNYIIALKGSTATVDLIITYVHVMFK